MDLSRGTITDLVKRIGQGDDSAVYHLWQRFRSRLLRRSAYVLKYADITWEDPESVASEAFADFVSYTRDSAPQFESRDDVWNHFTIATYRVGLRLRKYESASSRLKVWDADPITDMADQHDELNEIAFFDELHRLTDVHPKAGQIIALREKGLSAVEISKRTGIPIRTTYRVIEHLQTEFMERWYS